MGQHNSMTRRHPGTLKRVLRVRASTIDSGTETLTRPVHTEEGDHDKFAHYARKSHITESAVTGRPVIALCGKKWVPTRSPDDFPVCPDCKKIYDQLKPSGS